MKYSLFRLEKISGKAASFYTIKVDGEPLFDKFLETYRNIHENEMLDLIRKIRAMANITGIIEPHYKPNEGCKLGDNVVALFDADEKLLRLYGILKSENLIIIGSGGPKITRTWQEDSNLSSEVKTLCLISELLEFQLRQGSLKISEDGLFFHGNLDLN